MDLTGVDHKEFDLKGLIETELAELLDRRSEALDALAVELTPLAEEIAARAMAGQSTEIAQQTLKSRVMNHAALAALDADETMRRTISSVIMALVRGALAGAASI